MGHCEENQENYSNRLRDNHGLRQIDVVYNHIINWKIYLNYQGTQIYQDEASLLGGHPPSCMRSIRR